MTISFNFNFTTVVEVNNCCMYSENSNETQTQIISLFFDKRSHRDYVKFLFEKSFCVKSIVESDNSDYPDIPQCYKLYIVPLVGYSYSVSAKDDAVSNPFFLFSQYMQENNDLFVLLSNDTSKKLCKMKIIDVCDENKVSWADNEKYPNTIVTQISDRNEKMEYLLRYAQNYKF